MLVDVELPVAGAVYESIQCKGLLCEGGAVLAEALCGGAGDGDAEGLVAGVLLGAGGGVNDDTLACARGSNEDRGALGAGDEL